MELRPFRTPHWTRLPSGVEITSWPLLGPDDVFLAGSARTARAYAEALGARLPTSAELEEAFVLAIEQHAGRAPRYGTGPTLDPITAPCPTSTEEHSPRVIAALTALGVQWTDLAVNTGKPWLSDPGPQGKAAIYGWFVRKEHCHWRAGNLTWKEIVTYSARGPANALDYRVLQPLSFFHRDDDTACGYETHIVLVRP